MRYLNELIFITLLCTGTGTMKGESWSMDRCMAYAADHAVEVNKARLSADTDKAQLQQAVADFFPSVSASAGAQFSWGRNIDPETNTYNNITNFSNAYSIGASLTLFDGARTINRWKQAKAARQASLTNIELCRDEKALEVMAAYVDAVYCNGAVSLAESRLDDSRQTLLLARRREELGVGSLPDVAQAEAQTAADEYTLVNRRNLRDIAMLRLLEAMNLDADTPLSCDTTLLNLMPALSSDNADDIFAFASVNNPKAVSSEFNVKANRLQYSVAKGSYFPTITLNAGISTNYFKTLSGGYEAVGFASQFRNNVGEYVSVSVHIPIFSNLSNFTAVRRARNSWQSARLDRDNTLHKLRSEIAQAIADRDGYGAEIVSLERKAQADSLAYSLNRRKYEEGLLSLIDLQISANSLDDSRLQLLQRRMLYAIKSRLVDYYKGAPLIRDPRY